MAGTTKAPLGLIAGGGSLPGYLIAACRRQDRSCTTVALVGEADALPEEPSMWIRIGEAAKAFEKFHDDGVTEVVLAGKVRRPSLSELLPDWRTLKFLARAGTAAFTDKDTVGDDRLLRAVIAEVEREGFLVVGAEDVLTDLHVALGALGQLQPSESDLIDIDTGLQAARELGQADIGQAVVVCGRAIIAREGPAGTDALIRGVGGSSSAGAILVKTSKPQQDRRADLPVVGPETIKLCVAAGFKGVAVEAGGTLILDQDTVAGLADAAGIFVYAVDLPSPAGGGS